MKKLPLTVLSLVLVFAFALSVATQNKNSNTSANANTNSNSATNANGSNKVKRRPIFRANSDQIKQAQAILKQRGFYSGEQTNRLNPETRAGLRKYQQAEGLKVTGTLNKVTLEKMGIALTDKQKAM